MNSSNDTDGPSLSQGSPSSSSAPPRSPVGEVAASIGATLMGLFSVHKLTSLLDHERIDKTWGVILFALLVLPADVGLRLARRLLGGTSQK